MRHANNEKRETANDGRNKTTKINKKIRMLGEKETYKYLRIVETNTIKQVEMKEKLKKSISGERIKQLETKLCSRNLIKVINSWAVPLVRYSGPFLKWAREEL